MYIISLQVSLLCNALRASGRPDLAEDVEDQEKENIRKHRAMIKQMEIS